MKLRAIIGLAGLWLLAACTTTTPVAPTPVAETPAATEGWQARHAQGEAAREQVRFAADPLPDVWTDVAVTTAAVPIDNAALESGEGHLRYAGGVQISTDFTRLHGLSDLAFEDGERFWSISDEGLLVRGRIQLDAAGRLVGVTGVQARPLTDPDGQNLVAKFVADAEGLALMPGGELLVSFERYHRVWRYDRESGRFLGERAIPDYAFTENEGMEAIAEDTGYGVGGGFWAMGENGGVWLCEVSGCEASGPASDPAAPFDNADLHTTSLAALGDRQAGAGYYLVERAFDEATSRTTIRLSHLDPWRELATLPMQTELAVLTNPTTVDNFEGIAAVRRPDGGVRLYILSDDNFSDRQRTLLLAFDVVR